MILPKGNGRKRKMAPAPAQLRIIAEIKILVDENSEPYLYAAPSDLPPEVAKAAVARALERILSKEALEATSKIQVPNRRIIIARGG